MKLPTENLTNDQKRVIKYIEVTKTCWNWIGAQIKYGYGMVWYKGKRKLAHRVVYEWFNSIPEGHHLDHLCRNPSCVNPKHLEAVLPRENILRGIGAAARNFRKTHCIRGHLLVRENVSFNSNNYRICLLCRQKRNEDIFKVIGPSRNKDYCINGHEYTQENTRINKSGYRICIACHKKTANFVKLGGKRKDRSICKNGHKFTPENIYLNPRGIKECRTCRANRAKVKHEKFLTAKSQ